MRKLFKRAHPEPVPATDLPAGAATPVATAEADTGAADPAQPDPDAPPVRVLIVDDDDDVREVMRMTLERGGFDVVGVAADGREALELAEREQLDIVVLDLHMKDLGGLEVLPELREQSPKTKFVVFSAIGATHMTEAALAAGAVAFIVKGVSNQSIVQHLHRVANCGAVKVVRPYPLNRDYQAGEESPA